MLIERILRDPKGTEIKLPDGTLYHFKPEDAGGPHVAEVAEHHAMIFLNIPEGYRAVGGQSLAPAVAHAETPALLPPVTMEEAIKLLTDLGAEDAEYAAEVAWPDLFPETDTDDATDPTQPTELPEPTEPTGATEPTQPTETAPAPWHTVDDAALREVYEKEVGRKPHHKAARDTLIAQIEAARAAR